MSQIKFIVPLLFLFMVIGPEQVFATHSQGADLTYRCLGGNQYEIRLSFYRDCSGINAPNTATVSVSSANCGHNSSLSLSRVSGTGQEITLICPSMSTTCSGGTFPGVQEYVYTGIITLPQQCTDWTFGYSICCRNGAITTINNPLNQNIYVQAQLDNLNYPCNSSPTFTNPPVPFVCEDQAYCFNHGANDPDGDSLVYSLVTPLHNQTTPVVYQPGYSANQPVSSTIPTTINTQTGDVCMTPEQQEVTVFAVLVQEYRNGILIGSVIRDIQVQVIFCSNDNPYLTGIDGTGAFTLSACVGSTVNFTIPSFDPDAIQNVTLSWNDGIPTGIFDAGVGARPIGSFTWTPALGDVSPVPHCFTVTVEDDNCPFFGSQTYSFCITVGGAQVDAGLDQQMCNSSPNISLNGSVLPLSSNFQWINGAGTFTPSNLILNPTYTPSAGEIAAGGVDLVLSATGSGVCPTTNDTVTISFFDFAGTVTSNVTDVTCNGLGDGQASVSVLGGNPAFAYYWNTIPPQFGATAINLGTGSYEVTITDALGCSTVENVAIGEPAQLTLSTTNTDALCNGASGGTATMTVLGGTAPYRYSWNTAPPQLLQTATNLFAGNYMGTVIDDNGCIASANATVQEPVPVSITMLANNPTSCFGGSDGSIRVVAMGGDGDFSYLWNTNPVQVDSFATGLSAGSYQVLAEDGNGCSISASYTVTQPYAVQLNTSSVLDVSCNGYSDGSALVTPLGGTPGYSITWNTVPMQNGALASGLSAGSYLANVVDQKGCGAILSIDIIEPLPISINLTYDDTVCYGASSMLLASAGGGTFPYTYNWDQGLGIGASKTVTATVATIYTVTVTDDNGCPGGSSVAAIKVRDVRNAGLTVSNDTAVCIGESATINAWASSGNGPYTFLWNQGIGVAVGPMSVHPTTSGYYTAYLTDVCNSTIADSVYVDLQFPPVLELIIPDQNACGPVEVEFSNSLSAPNAIAYVWSLDNGLLGSGDVVTHTFEQSGSYEVYVTAFSEFGCISRDTADFEISINPTAIADFDVNSVVLDTDDPTILIDNRSALSTSFFWDFGDGDISMQEEPGSHLYENHGSFQITLIANNEFGCPDTATKLIQVVPRTAFYAPNVFTPNGDGLNDKFITKGENITGFDLFVFDRWGDMIHHTNNINSGWDGKYKGRDVQQDVYIWKVLLRNVIGENQEYTGHVSVVR